MRFTLSATVLLSVVVSTAACGRSRDGLVGWWKFDEGSGERAADASGNGNHAIIRNGDWGEGRLGAALAMDGGNDGIVVIPLSESLRATADAITVTAWTFRTAEHNADVFGRGYPGLFFGFHGPQFKWEIVNDAGEYASCYADPDHRAELGRWIHMAATYDGEFARLYVNGEHICRRRLSGPIKMSESPFTISGYFTEDGAIVDEISGRIDDVRVYNRALAVSEIRTIYESAPR